MRDDGTFKSAEDLLALYAARDDGSWTERGNLVEAPIER